MTYIFEAIRTPIAKANGIYKKILPEELTAHLLQNILYNYPKLSKILDKVILGNAFGVGGNPTRYASLKAGLNESLDSFTMDSQCSSGLKSIEVASAYLKAGLAQCIIAGGMESRSLAPEKFYHLNDPRIDTSRREFKIAKFSPDQSGNEPLLDAAENVALKYQIEKAKMQDWMIESHLKANNAKPILEKYICKIHNSDLDQSIKNNLSRELLQKAQSENLIDSTNTAHYNDAAAVVLLGNESIKKFGFKPIAKIVASYSMGFNPKFAPESILEPIKRMLELKIPIDLFEINESFAVSPIMAAKVFEIPYEKINVLGGNLAYGHPFGASGTINLIHLLAALRHNKLKYGLVAIPAAGGLASAMIIENLV